MTVWPQVRSLLRSRSATEQCKEGDEACEAELELMLEELGAWQQKNPKKDLTCLTLINHASTEETATGSGSEEDFESEGSSEEEEPFTRGGKE